jgi:uncharacterized protein YyaL (SSP411 family)
VEWRAAGQVRDDRRVNRLAGAMSPYLQQHADNPVDWWEWGDAPFAEARDRDVPVLLSIGYAACHWCHVMAHESFEDEATAAYLNEHFVSIKVDREERPDLDAVYMNAVQAMTGQGGWPMTVVLTPERAPFFAGTYFPPQPRHGMPSFTQLLQALSDAWRTRRDEVLTSAATVVQRLNEVAAPIAGVAPPSAEALAASVAALARTFDPVNAGFGAAPKFPPSMTLEHLLRHHDRTGDGDARHMLVRTLDAMARGGIYDQLGGGFARYSVDAQWVVPHFEKMLYDNALLLRVYAQTAIRTGEPLHRRVAGEVADFLLEDLRTDEGGFASSLDADTEGVEGKFYVWTPDEVIEALGADDGPWANDVFGVTATGTFEHGASVLQLRADADDAERFARVRRRLLSARAHRVSPARDDKVVAAWNGLAISGLVHASIALDRSDLLAAAEAAADLLLSVHLAEETTADGARFRLRRVSRDGRVGGSAGVLEDYGCVADGLLTLYAATGRTEWFTIARALLDDVVDRFMRDDDVTDTARDGERLITRVADPTDNATPSGRSAVGMALVTLASLTGESRYRDAADRALAASAELARVSPRFAGWALTAAEALVAGPVQIAVVDPGDAQPDERLPAGTSSSVRSPWSPLHAAALRIASPGVVVARGTADDDDPLRPALLHDRSTIDGRAAAYPCRGFVCRLPVTDAAALAASVRELAD